jgi:hypothetical protein
VGCREDWRHDSDLIADHIARCGAKYGISGMILRGESLLALRRHVATAVRVAEAVPEQPQPVPEPACPSPLDYARHRLSLGRARREIGGLLV